MIFLMFIKLLMKEDEIASKRRKKHTKRTKRTESSSFAHKTSNIAVKR